MAVSCSLLHHHLLSPSHCHLHNSHPSFLSQSPNPTTLSTLFLLEPEASRALPLAENSTKKSKPSNSPVKEDTKQVLKSSASPREVSGCLVIASTNRLGPDPEDLPKDVSRVFSGNSVIMTGVMGDLEKFSGSVFTLSPPPSSLPLPKFSLRPTKLSCNAEAAGIDAGATDNLRRLLRLR